MTIKQFEDLVVTALDHLPETFARTLDNVEVVVEIWPTPQDLAAGGVMDPGMTLLGLYRGVPQTKRSNYTAVLPDKIIIFAGPIVRAYGEDGEAVKEQVRKTVLHEIGHHFGMSDEEIRNAGH